VLLSIALLFIFLVIFLFTTKSLIRFCIAKIFSPEQFRELRNFLIGFIGLLGFFYVLSEYSGELGFETVCNSYQLENNSEKCNENSG
jgi:hypothetical protein